MSPLHVLHLYVQLRRIAECGAPHSATSIPDRTPNARVGGPGGGSTRDLID